MTAIENPFLRVPDLLGEVSQLQLSIERVASFSLEEASDFNDHAEYRALDSWTFRAIQVLASMLTYSRCL
jgi:hypothetical protein